MVANALSRIARYSVAIGITASAVQSSVYVVSGGHRAVIFNRFTGVEENVRGEVSDYFMLCIVKTSCAFVNYFALTCR